MRPGRLDGAPEIANSFADSARGLGQSLRSNEDEKDNYDKEDLGQANAKYLH